MAYTFSYYYKVNLKYSSSAYILLLMAFLSVEFVNVLPYIHMENDIVKQNIAYDELLFRLSAIRVITAQCTMHIV